MKYFTFLTFIVSFIFTNQVLGQGCDEFRYINDIATTTSKETIQYGQNINGTGSTQDLYMDIYTPDGDTRTDRPTIVYAFGGSFIGGSRDDVADFCQDYARRGYVTAAIDYRLYNILAQGIPDSIGMLEEVVMAVSDMKGAVRFLRNSFDNGNPYGIDPNNIYAGGISAGAIVALHAAYLTPTSTNIPSYLTTVITENGGIEGDTDLPGDSYTGTSAEIQAVINMSGALHRANFVEAGGPPVVSCHSENDGTVPYGYGIANVGVPIVSVEGSSKIHERAQALGITSSFYSVAEGGHVVFYFQEPTQTEYDNFIKTFMHDEIVCNGIVPTNDLIDISQSIHVYPNPSIDKANIVLEGYSETYNIQLIDQLGKVIRTIEGINDNIYELQRKNLAAGIYYVKITLDNKEFAPVNKRVVFR